MSLIGGGGDSVVTVLELLGVASYVQGQQTIARGWHDAASAQEKYSQSAARMGAAGNLLTAGLSAPLAAVTLSSAKLGLAAVESESMVKNTFGAMTEDINKWSENATKKLGANGYEMRRQAAVMQQMFQGAGFDPGKAAQMSKGVVDLKNDLVSFFNVADSDATAALQSGLAGETEPLRRYGIFLSDSALKAEALKLGIQGVNGELSEQQKIQARFSYISSTLAKNNVTGDAERTADSPANRLRRMQNELTQAGTEFGMALLPLADPAIKMLNALTPALTKVIDLFKQMPQPVQAATLALALGAGPALKLGATLLNLRGNSLAAAAAKKVLGGETDKDAKAEENKTGIAEDEGKALGGVGDAAEEVKSKIQDMAKEKLEEALGDPKAALAKLKAFAATPLMMPAAGQGWLGNLGHSLGMRAGVISQPTAFGAGGAPITGGMAMASGALGAAAGYGAYDDYKTLGLSSAQAIAAGAFTGVAAAGIALFAPGGMLAVGIATGLRYAFNELVNRPMEREAEAGNGLDPEVEARQSTSTKAQQADDYFKLAAQKDAEAQAVADDPLGQFNTGKQEELRGEAETFRRVAQERLNSHAKDKKNAERNSMAADMEAAAARYRTGAFATIDTAADRKGDLGAPTAGADNGAYEGDWSARARDAQAGPSSGPAGTTRGSSNQLRNGTRRFVLDVEPDQGYELAERLKRHNTLGSYYGD